jgi:adenosine deaminase CECR1
VPENALNEIRQALPQVSASANSFFEFTPDLNAKLAKLAEEKAQEYDYLRNETASYEAGLGFEHSCTLSASDLEKQANQILQELRRDDVERYYNTGPKRTGYAGQEHPRFCGDHFLSNADIIEKTQVFKLIRAMPKGAHLHIHFNANLRPHVLLGIAKTMERMFIWSNIPLDTQEAYDRCRIQFSIMNDSAVTEKGAGDLFDPAYKGGTVMQFGQFLRKFPGGEDAADRWLQSKLVFHEEEAHNLLQTADGWV